MSLGLNMKLMCSLVITIFLYVCESWILTADLRKRMHAFAMRCYRRLLNTSYKDHVTSEDVCRNIQAAIGKYDKLLTLVKKQKLKFWPYMVFFGIVMTILQGTVQGKRKKVDRIRGGETILRSGQGWTLLPQLGQLKTGQGGKGLL